MTRAYARDATDGRRRWLQRTPPALGVGAAVLLLGWTCLVYLPVGGYGFVSYDDPEYVTKSPLVRPGLSPDGLRRAFRDVHHGNWHPFTTLSYMVESELFGLAPGVRHRVNLALHLLNTALLFLLLARTTQRPWRALAVAALSALHPLHVGA